MRAHLIYFLHNSAIAGTAAGQNFILPAHRGSRFDLGSWTKAQGLDLVWETVEYGAGGTGGGPTHLRRRARTLPPPRDPSTCSHCVSGARVAWVDDGGAGLFIHGWPPCNGLRCIVVSHGWETLARALATQGGGSIRVV
jgi:hypothetical protein